METPRFPGHWGKSEARSGIRLRRLSGIFEVFLGIPASPQTVVAPPSNELGNRDVCRPKVSGQ